MEATKCWRFRLTNICNVKCVFCHGEGFSLRGPKRYLDIEVLEKLFEGFVREKDSIALSGGEPLLHPKLDGIVRLSVDRVGKDHCHLNTNGILLGNRIGTLVNSGLHHLHVNLMTLDPRFYKAIYGVRFRKSLWNDLLLASREGLHVNINAVIAKSYSECGSSIPTLMKACEDAGFDLSIIEDYSDYDECSKGREFQSIWGKFVRQRDYLIKRESAGRTYYNKGSTVVRVVAPCAPALAWNGTTSDDAYVVLETGIIRRFSGGALVEA